MASDSTECRVLYMSAAVFVSLYSYGSALSFLFSTRAGWTCKSSLSVPRPAMSPP